MPKTGSAALKLTILALAMTMFVLSLVILRGNEQPKPDGWTPPDHYEMGAPK